MGSSGFWCNNCAMSHRPHVFDHVKICCSFCGKVLSDYNGWEEVTFAKNAAGQYKRNVDIRGTNKDEKVHYRKDDETGGATKHVAMDDCDFDDSHGSDKSSGESGEELDTFSDIDDVEIDSYILNEKEKHYKKIIWEELNREYIEREQKRANEAGNPVPRTAAEATRQKQMLAKKTLESKINHAVLDELFNESLSPQKAKKIRSGEGGTKAKQKIDGRLGGL